MESVHSRKYELGFLVLLMAMFALQYFVYFYALPYLTRDFKTTEKLIVEK